MSIKTTRPKRPRDTDDDDIAVSQTEANKRKTPRLKLHTKTSIYNIQREDGTLEYRSICNEVDRLLKIQREAGEATLVPSSAAISLCRIFSQLLNNAKIQYTADASGEEILIIRWLHERFRDFCDLLLAWVCLGSIERCKLALNLLIQLARDEVNATTSDRHSRWLDGLYVKLLEAVLGVRAEVKLVITFTTDFVLPHEDLWLQSLRILNKLLVNGKPLVENVIEMLSLFNYDKLLNRTSKQPSSEPITARRGSTGMKPLRREVEQAWKSVLGRDLNKGQRKRVLALVSQCITPWFTQPELLMDFLSNCFGEGRSISHMALEGIFFLMQKGNLDYPRFFPKVYSLLDRNCLHSRHRAHTLRLISTFLASTHLPAVLVASFIKRLSRLCLHAPPQGTIAIVPWIYNLLKDHPACTLMIHNQASVFRSLSVTQSCNRDPFDFEEEDPMITNASQSSLWEIETLQSHFHPQVAIISKLISDQFTKQSYRLDDFMEHNFDEMIEVELSKKLKRLPVVEYEIPKTILAQDQVSGPGTAVRIVSLWIHDNSDHTHH